MKNKAAGASRGMLPQLWFYLPPMGRCEGDGNQRLGLMSTF